LSSPATSLPSGNPAAAVGQAAHTADAGSAEAGLTALRSPGAHLCLWLTAGLGLALDLWSKQWAFTALGQGGRRVLIPNVFEFHTMMNDGALFGIGSGQTTLFLVASVLALALVFWMFAASSPRSWLLHIAFGGILAGAAGNMYDRVFVRLVGWPSPAGVIRYYVKGEPTDGGQIVLREYPPRAGDAPRVLSAAEAARIPKAVGHVRDFLKFSARVFCDREVWPWVFNVADMLLVGGVGILAVHLWRDRGAARSSSRLDAARGKA
jgi:lipoprotein signal peptidase